MDSIKLIVRDITVRKRLEEDLAKQRDRGRGGQPAEVGVSRHHLT